MPRGGPRRFLPLHDLQLLLCAGAEGFPCVRGELDASGWWVITPMFNRSSETRQIPRLHPRSCVTKYSFTRGYIEGHRTYLAVAVCVCYAKPKLYISCTPSSCSSAWSNTSTCLGMPLNRTAPCASSSSLTLSSRSTSCPAATQSTRPA